VLRLQTQPVEPEKLGGLRICSKGDKSSHVQTGPKVAILSMLNSIMQIPYSPAVATVAKDDSRLSERPKIASASFTFTLIVSSIITLLSSCVCVLKKMKENGFYERIGT
jgi:hypothetical protein